MLSITIVPLCPLFSSSFMRSMSSYSFPLISFIVNPTRSGGVKQERLFSSFSFSSSSSSSSSFSLYHSYCSRVPAVSNWGFGSFAGVSSGEFRLAMCKDVGGWETEGENWDLNADILKFMKSSEKPGKFPSKKELINAGRIDLVDAILKEGGWLSMGWDLGDESNENHMQEIDYLDENNGGFLRERMLEAKEERISSFTVNSSSSSLASSSGRSMDTEAENDCGIDGILSRLEKERNANFDLINKYNGNFAENGSNYTENDPLLRTIVDLRVAGRSRRKSLSLGEIMNGVKSCSKLDDFRESQSSQCLDIELNGNNIPEVKGHGSELNTTIVLTKSQLQSRLQHLESELSSVLHSVRSNSSDILLQKGLENSSSDDLLQLSDVWEFKESEIMNARDKLRSLRAKLAVLEGKMALAIIEAQKSAEEKQKKIDGAHRALRLLRTACVMWPNSASEVHLVGSFDGWTSQRKMERTSSGIFTMWLKLYPGKYEMKFIVDGEWKIDPLRPIVNNDGHENNLLIVT